MKSLSSLADRLRACSCWAAQQQVLTAAADQLVLLDAVGEGCRNVIGEAERMLANDTDDLDCR